MKSQPGVAYESIAYEKHMLFYGLLNMKNKLCYLSLFLCLSCISLGQYCQKKDVKSVGLKKKYEKGTMVIYLQLKPSAQYEYFLNFDMVSEIHIRLCMKKSDLLKNIFVERSRLKLGLLILLKNLVINFFLNLVYNETLYYFAIFLLKSHVWEKIWLVRYGSKCSWPIGLQDL